ncbi:hypothetical protein DTO271G3_6861 [Paecilomyces variotii]|nr:hypothetical protein DTO271G3_6861 [Paecilomyces variotii]
MHEPRDVVGTREEETPRLSLAAEGDGSTSSALLGSFRTLVCAPELVGDLSFAHTVALVRLESANASRSTETFILCLGPCNYYCRP